MTYVEPYRKRVQATANGHTVVDSERVVLVHRTGRPPTYAFPAADVHGVVAAPLPELDGYVVVSWSSVDAWFEEGERTFGIRNPYHRIDCVRAGRRLRVVVSDVCILDTTDTVSLYETSLDPKLYVDRSHVAGVELIASETTTYCPYKGTASYWTAVVGDTRIDDIAWSYEDPTPESSAIAGLLSFYAEKATVEMDVPSPAI